jgi:hypothetical protein
MPGNDSPNAVRSRNRKHIDRQFNRIFISVKDMDRAVEFSTAARDFADDPAVQRDLITAAIVSYARSFSKNQDHPMAISHAPISLKHLLRKNAPCTPSSVSFEIELLHISDFDMNPVRSAKHIGTAS